MKLDTNEDLIKIEEKYNEIDQKLKTAIKEEKRKLIAKRNYVLDTINKIKTLTSKYFEQFDTSKITLDNYFYINIWIDSNLILAGNYRLVKTAKYGETDIEVNSSLGKLLYNGNLTNTIHYGSITINTNTPKINPNFNNIDVLLLIEYPILIMSKLDLIKLDDLNNYIIDVILGTILDDLSQPFPENLTELIQERKKIVDYLNKIKKIKDNYKTNISNIVNINDFVLLHIKNKQKPIIKTQVLLYQLIENAITDDLTISVKSDLGINILNKSIGDKIIMPNGDEITIENIYKNLNIVPSQIIDHTENYKKSRKNKQ